MTKTDFLNGNLVSTPNNLPEVMDKISIRFELLKEALGTKDRMDVEDLKVKETLMISVNTTVTVGVVEKIKGDTVDLNLTIPIVALKGDNFGLARNYNNHWRLIGWGELI
jgi:translation initiation factor 2 subunit 3